MNGGPAGLFLVKSWGWGDREPQQVLARAAPCGIKANTRAWMALGVSTAAKLTVRRRFPLLRDPLEPEYKYLADKIVHTSRQRSAGRLEHLEAPAIGVQQDATRVEWHRARSATGKPRSPSPTVSRLRHY